jgi:hypothetical protein
MIVHADSLAELLAKLADDMAFYRLVVDWHDMTIETREYCAACQGRGEVAAARRGHVKRCRVCKGSPIFRESTAAVAAMSETSCLRLRNRERADLAAWQAKAAAGCQDSFSMLEAVAELAAAGPGDNCGNPAA